MGNCCGKRRLQVATDNKDMGQHCSSSSSKYSKRNGSVDHTDNNNNQTLTNIQPIKNSKTTSHNEDTHLPANRVNSLAETLQKYPSELDGEPVGVIGDHGLLHSIYKASNRDTVKKGIIGKTGFDMGKSKGKSVKNSNFQRSNSKKSTKSSKSKSKSPKSSNINYTFSDDNNKTLQKVQNQENSIKDSISDSNSLNSSNNSLQCKIQHIKDREDPEEIDVNLHPFDLCGPQTFFLQKALEDKRKLTANNKNSGKNNGSVTAIAKAARYKKYSSCSNMIMDDSTLSRPNQKAMVKCVALALYYHIRHRRVDKTGKNFYAMFDELQHPLTKDAVPEDYYKREPDHKTIYRFLRQLFTSAQLSAECAIVMLVYLERIMSYGELRIDPSNWKRLLLGSVLLASKVWDDQAVWNVDYCQILQELTVEDMNELERHYLNLLQFNINISGSVYAKYYFDLRHLAVHAGLIFNTHPLTKKRATKLDASTRLHFQINRENRASHILPKQKSVDETDKKKEIIPAKSLNRQNSYFKPVQKLLLHKSHSCMEHLEKKNFMYVFS